MSLKDYADSHPRLTKILLRTLFAAGIYALFSFSAGLQTSSREYSIPVVLEVTDSAIGGGVQRVLGLSNKGRPVAFARRGDLWVSPQELLTHVFLILPADRVTGPAALALERALRVTVNDEELTVERRGATPVPDPPGSVALELKIERDELPWLSLAGTAALMNSQPAGLIFLRSFGLAAFVALLGIAAFLSLRGNNHERIAAWLGGLHRLRPPAFAPVALLIAAYGLFVVSMLSFALHMTPHELSRIYYKADMLGLPSNFHQLFGPQINGWFMSPAPYYFPDTVLYFALYPLLGLQWATMAYGFLQTIALLAMTQILLKILYPRCGKIGHAWLVLAYAAVFIFGHTVIAFEAFANYFFMNVHHAGALFATMLAIIFALLYLRDSRLRHVVIFFFVVALGALSDKLLVVSLVLPLSSAGLLLFSGKRFRRPTILLLVAMYAATVVGFALDHLTYALLPAIPKNLPVQQPPLEALKVLVDSLSAPPTGIYFFITVLATAFALRAWLMETRPAGNPIRGLFFLFAVACMIAAWILPPLTVGTALRYTLHACWLAAIVLILPASVRADRSILQTTVIGSGLLLFWLAVGTGAQTFTPSGWARISDYRAPLAACADEQTPPAELIFAEYEALRHLQFFSERDWQIHPYGTMAIEAALLKSPENGRPRAVAWLVSAGLADSIAATLGPPRFRKECPAQHVFVLYGRTESD
ncbi:MAG: hypothetical protein NXI24_13155 [bacterium]|nr:hypothetical protein [bacterium]